MDRLIKQGCDPGSGLPGVPLNRNKLSSLRYPEPLNWLSMEPKLGDTSERKKWRESFRPSCRPERPRSSFLSISVLAHKSAVVVVHKFVSRLIYSRVHRSFYRTIHLSVYWSVLSFIYDSVSVDIRVYESYCCLHGVGEKRQGAIPTKPDATRHRWVAEPLVDARHD